MTGEPIKLLLVDDTPENLVALDALLRRDGVQLLTARSGAEALELLLVHEVALALLDVHMPEMDGFELAELMRGAARTRHVPIIFVTAGTRDAKRVFEGYETGAVDFLFKPIDPHILRSKVDVFLELAEQRRQMAEALRLHEIFVGILGHDLRNPLGTLITGVAVLESQLRDERQRKVLARMTSAGKRMTTMIEQLLDLTRARLGNGLGFMRVRQPLDLRELIQRTIDELGASFPGREIAFRASGDCTTTGDPERLLQMFSNVIGNALTHGDPGGTVQVTVMRHAGLSVVIHNDGAIPPALLPTLFEPFRARPKGAPPSPGLGLGLFIAHQIAAAHGGDLSVASSAEDGTSVTVRLPPSYGGYAEPSEPGAKPTPDDGVCARTGGAISGGRAPEPAPTAPTPWPQASPVPPADSRPPLS